jgi:hypothetical protein
MKRINPILLVSVLCGFALSSHGVNIINDIWIDGTRDDPAAPVYSENGVDSDSDGNLESVWFNGGGGTMGVVNGSPGVTPGTLRTTVDTASTSSWTTYFTSPGAPVTLANAGDKLTLTWVFTPTGVDTTGNTSQSFRLALVNTPSTDRLAADGNPADSTFTGYAMFMNMATSFGRSSPFSLMKRSLLTSGNLLSSSGNWTSLLDDGNTGDTGYADGTQYTFTLSLTRNASDGLDIGAIMSGGSIGNDGTLEDAFTDTAPDSFSFDTFAVRPSRADQSASQFDTSLFKVDFAPVPEPSTLALVGIGLFGLIASSRRARRSS